MDSAQWRQAGLILLLTGLAAILISLGYQFPNEAIQSESRTLSGLWHRLFVSTKTRQIDEILTPEEKAQAYLQRGIDRFLKSRFPEAITDLTAGLKLRSDAQTRVALHSIRGAAYMCQKRYSQAAEDFAAEIAGAPDELVGYYNRGLAFAYAGAYEHARADFVRFGALTPAYFAKIRKDVFSDSSPFRFPVSNHASILRGIDNQEAQFGGRYYYGLALVDGREGRYRSAIENITRAMHHSAASSFLYAERARDEFWMGDWRAAWRDYGKSARLAWSAPRSRHASGMTC